MAEGFIEIMILFDKAELLYLRICAEFVPPLVASCFINLTDADHRAGAKIPVRCTVPLYTRNGLFTRCTKICIPGMDVKIGCKVSVHPVWCICPCLHCERPLCHPGVVLIMRNPDDTSTKISSILYTACWQG